MPLFCDVTERRPGRRQCGRGGRRGLAYRMAAAVERVASVISGTEKVGKINTLAASRSARSSETRSEMLCKRASVDGASGLGAQNRWRPQSAIIAHGTRSI